MPFREYGAKVLPNRLIRAGERGRAAGTLRHSAPMKLVGKSQKGTEGAEYDVGGAI
jgi:hypothetical protein